MKSNTNPSNFLLCTVYRPPGTCVAFWDLLNISLERAFESCSNIIIVGDFNQNLLNPNDRHLYHIISLNITLAIRVTNSDTLDITYTKSDHKATLVLIDFDNILISVTKRKVWLYNRANFADLNRLIDNQNWDFIDTLNVNETR